MFNYVNLLVKLCSRKFLNISDVMVVVVGKQLLKMGILYAKAGGGSFLLLLTSYFEV